MLGNLSRTIVAGGLVLLAGSPVEGAVPAAQVIRSRDLARTAGLALGSRLRLAGVQVADTGEAAEFLLERFEVFAPDAEITIHGDGGRTEVTPAPANAYFRGGIDGEPGSRVFLAVLADGGGVQGIVERAGETYLIGGEDEPAKALGAPLEMRRVEPAMLKASRGQGFTCGNGELPQSSLPFLDPQAGSKAAALVPATANAVIPSHTARVAIETDYEFYALFNNTINEVNYVANLIGYASTVYTAEINTSLVVQTLSLWTTSNDPWTQTSSTCGLMEFGRYWNLNRTHVSRTIAHFMSGRAVGGGVAWVNALCSGPFNSGSSCPGLPTDAPWGGAYGFTGSLSGGFNIQSPTVVWDILSISHEIGHNFGSPHSHCYGGVDGNASPIDGCPSTQQAGDCGAGCSCSGALPGPQGSGSGTIMSYCHLRPGNYSNITMTFGTGFSYGVQPGREAALMSSTVTTTAASNPGCLALIDKGLIFMDGFEVGTVSGAWLRTP